MTTSPTNMATPRTAKKKKVSLKKKKNPFYIHNITSKSRAMQPTLRMTWMTRKDFSFPEEPKVFKRIFGEVCTYGKPDHDELGMTLFLSKAAIVKSPLFVKFFPRFTSVERVKNGAKFSYVRRNISAYKKLAEAEQYFNLEEKKLPSDE